VTTVKVSSDLRDRLSVRATRAGVPIASVIETALSALVEQEFWAQLDTDLATLMSDPVAWSEYVAERDMWLSF